MLKSTERQTDDGQKAIRIAHLSFQLRWAKNGETYISITRIEETFDLLHGSTFFSTMDLTSGYNQRAVAEEDTEKTAFTMPWCLYEFNRMAFGLTNALLNDLWHIVLETKFYIYC
jgi:hypothetical protein